MNSANYFRLEKDGFEICDYKISKKKLEKILFLIKDFEIKYSKKIVFSNESSHFHNFHLYCNNLKKLLFDDVIKILYRKYFKGNYCLRNIVLTNLQKDSKLSVKRDRSHPIGEGWHRDSPQFYDLNKKSQCLGLGLTFQFVIALDDTDRENSTKYLAGSHKFQPSSHRPNIKNKKILEKRYENVDLVLKRGQIAIMDDHVFHKTGYANFNSRRIIFINFTPWYIKPYFSYNKTVKKNDSLFIKYIMHANSTPPNSMSKLQLTNKSVNF